MPVRKILGGRLGTMTGREETNEAGRDIYRKTGESSEKTPRNPHKDR